jgi:nucleoside-diphosphate-sugar epimerase
MKILVTGTAGFIAFSTDLINSAKKSITLMVFCNKLVINCEKGMVF